MNSVRKLLGRLILIFLAFPLFFGCLWTAGITRAVFSPAFLSKLPIRTAQHLPALTEQMVDLMEHENRGRRVTESDRVWAAAFRKSPYPLSLYIQESGIIQWMEEDLSKALYKTGEIWQGKVLPQDVELSNRRIREALTGEKFDLFTKNLMDQLPSCDASQRYLWEKVPVKGWDDADLPACRPDPELLAQARERFKSDFLKEVPERVVLVKASTFSQEDLSWVSKLSSLTYLLLFVPLLFVLLGAWLAFPGLVPFLRGLGFFGILAGGLSWLGAWFLKTIIGWSSTPLRFFEVSYDPGDALFMSFIQPLFSFLAGEFFQSIVFLSTATLLLGVFCVAFSHFYQERKGENSAES